MALPDNGALTKVSIARAQLMTALDLFVHDKDPISVHCLACGGGEVIEGIANASGKEIFSTHILETHPHMDRGAVRRARNQYWNAFKHFEDRNGLQRNDEELLGRFGDTINDNSLYIGWWDYLSLQKRLPVITQVFQIWYYAIYEERLGPGTDVTPFRKVFPGIQQQDRVEQKRRLRRVIEKYRKDAKLLADPATENF
jgi:hypothetical protein